ncbi:MAG TPA: hypothetical protein VMV72_00255 [Verrucomicrobiae bacterium]|nr:hypothetical protein [Verrucomicrobiae bacterium]
MKCFTHRDAEAVAVCMHCGKGICTECAGVSESGRQVCSPECARSREARRWSLNGRYLYVLVPLFLIAAIYYVAEDIWQLSIFLSLAAFFCWKAGRRSLWEDREGAGLSALYYRTGDALEKAHRFRQCLSELLAHYAGFSDAPITLAQLDAADQKGRTELLRQVYSAAQERVGGKMSPADLAGVAGGHARDFEFCRVLGEDYYERHARDVKSLSGRERLRNNLFRAHLPVRDDIFWLVTLNRQLAQKATS